MFSVIHVASSQNTVFRPDQFPGLSKEIEFQYFPYILITAMEHLHRRPKCLNFHVAIPDVKHNPKKKNKIEREKEI